MTSPMTMAGRNMQCDAPLAIAPNDTSSFTATTPTAEDTINDVLLRLGYGFYQPETIVSFLGRNENLAGKTSSGVDIFAKWFNVAHAYGAGSIRRTTEFARFTDQVTFKWLRWPHSLGYDEQAGVHLFEWLRAAQTGAQLADDGELDGELAHEIGAALGELHEAVPDGESEITRTPLLLPPVDYFNGVPLDFFIESSGGLLHVWHLLQGDEALHAAVIQLRKKETDVIAVPIHGDIRLDQILVSEGVTYIADWEEFRLGDPARDVGGFVGEWLFRSVLNITRPDSAVAADHDELSHEVILARGTQQINEVRPTLASFWKGYEEARPSEDYRQLKSRAVAFAGWHLFDRILAAVEWQSELSALYRASAGIGRNAILHPDRFVQLLGLGEGMC